MMEEFVIKTSWAEFRAARDGEWAVVVDFLRSKGLSVTNSAEEVRDFVRGRFGLSTRTVEIYLDSPEPSFCEFRGAKGDPAQFVLNVPAEILPESLLSWVKERMREGVT
jgi:hypothetical protein